MFTHRASLLQCWMCPREVITKMRIAYSALDFGGHTAARKNGTSCLVTLFRCSKRTR